MEMPSTEAALVSLQFFASWILCALLIDWIWKGLKKGKERSKESLTKIRARLRMLITLRKPWNESELWNLLLWPIKACKDI
jgi:hypothetical protein